jgi:hypothetical protein
MFDYVIFKLVQKLTKKLNHSSFTNGWFNSFSIDIIFFQLNHTNGADFIRPKECDDIQKTINSAVVLSLPNINKFVKPGHLTWSRLLWDDSFNLQTGK